MTSTPFIIEKERLSDAYAVIPSSNVLIRFTIERLKKGSRLGDCLTTITQPTLLKGLASYGGGYPDIPIGLIRASQVRLAEDGEFST